jgi:histidine ammonia-lyase
VPFYDRDRYFSPDIEASKRLIAGSAYNRFMPSGILPSLSNAHT